MTMTNHEYGDPGRRNAPVPFLQRFRSRPAEPTLSDQVEDLLATAAPRIAAAYPPRESGDFTAQIKRFAEAADAQTTAHNRLLEDHRVAMIENEILRARVADHEKYAEDLRVYWERQYEQVNRERQRLSRLYHALLTRLDSIVEFITGTREQAKREAFAPDEANEPREDVHAVRPRVAFTEDEANAPLPPEPVRTADRLPAAAYTDNPAGIPARD